MRERVEGRKVKDGRESESIRKWKEVGRGEGEAEKLSEWNEKKEVREEKEKREIREG